MDNTGRDYQLINNITTVLIENVAYMTPILASLRPFSRTLEEVKPKTCLLEFSAMVSVNLQIFSSCNMKSGLSVLIAEMVSGLGGYISLFQPKIYVFIVCNVGMVWSNLCFSTSVKCSLFLETSSS